MKTGKDKRFEELAKTFKEYEPQPASEDEDEINIEKIENSILDKVEKSINEKFEKWENDRKDDNSTQPTNETDSTNNENESEDLENGN